MPAFVLLIVLLILHYYIHAKQNLRPLWQIIHCFRTNQLRVNLAWRRVPIRAKPRNNKSSCFYVSYTLSATQRPKSGLFFLLCRSTGDAI